MKILVGLSGGVDSAVTAYLLKKAGHEVHAGFMINYLTDDDSCPTRIDMKIAKEVAEYLDIPFFTFDYREEYETRIIRSIYDGYRNGLTPNPDILCNNLVKFDLFLAEALSYGYDAIATGHYARITEDDNGFHLLKGVDANKDQSYFLSRLSQSQLAHALFPIGSFEKSEVRSIANAAGLPNATRKDSQGLCFVGKVNMKEFLARELPKIQGDVLYIDGKVIGQHEGAHFYTIGQRRGIEVGGGPALFVLKKDVLTNTITVGPESALTLFQSSLTAIEWHQIAPKVTFPLVGITSKIRYRQDDIPTRANLLKNSLLVDFMSPVRAVTPGQTIALYCGEELLGSAVIAG